MVLYFTGTGNSAYIARRIADLTGDVLISMNERIREHNFSEIKTDNRLVFVVPAYAWRIPRIVEAWIDKTRFEGNVQAYFIMNCGGSIGNAGKYIRKLCGRKKMTYMGVTGIVMPENYIALYKAPGKAKAKQIVEQAEPFITSAAEVIQRGAAFPEQGYKAADRLNSSVVNPVFYRFIVKAKKFRAGDTCTGCGKCVKECPLNNIRIADNKPVWGKNCTHCMACICKCPAEAIEYGKSSAGKVRYQCPL